MQSQTYRFTLRLWNEQSCEDTRKHEGREDLHNVVEPGIGVLGGGTTGAERGNGTLGDDGTNLTRASGNSVRCRSVASWKALARNNESGGVGSPVEKQLNENVDGQHGMAAEMVVSETPDQEQNSEHDETNELENLATDRVDGRNSQPVSGNGTGADEDAVSSGQVVELVVDSSATSVANGLEDSAGVQSETVEGDIEQEPRHGSSEEDLAVPEFAVEAEEITE